MVRVANPYKLEAYKHESFEPGEVWYFRASKSDDDDEQIEALTRTYVTKDLPESEIEQTVARGKNVRKLIGEHLEPQIIMSGRRATLLHMTHHWTLHYPADYAEPQTDEAGESVLREDGTPALVPSPLAGQPMPVTAETIGILVGITDDAYWHMSELWAADGRTEKQEAAFPGGGVRLAENRGRPTAKKARPVSS